MSSVFRGNLAEFMQIFSVRRREPVRELVRVAVSAVAFLLLLEPAAAEGPYFSRLGQFSGIGYYVPQKWGLLKTELVNPTDEPVELLATSYFDGDPNLQYGREFWIPPRAIRRDTYPIFAPARLAQGGRATEVHSLLFDRTGSGEVMITRPSGPVLHTDRVPVLYATTITGMISDRGRADARDDPHSYEAAVAMRLSFGLTRRVIVMEERFLPPTPESLEGLGQLILVNDGIARDAAGLSAVRRWVQAGGKLWIMLDEVDRETVDLLLGDTLDWQVVDRVPLTEVTFEAVESRREDLTAYETRHFDDPVDLLQVIATDVEVLQTVNGWPVSFWKDFGRGAILLTALEARAWIHSWEEGRSMSEDIEERSTFVADPPLRDIGRRFFRPPSAPPVEVEKFEPFLSEQIGYEIIGRGQVTAVLGAFCGALLVAGLWFAQQGRLQRLGWFGPTASLAAAVVLVATGMQSRRSVPPAVAVAQYVDVVPDLEEVRSAGLVAMYNPQESDERIGALQGGIFRPDLSGLENTTKRMLWTDFDAWHWENLSLPSGTRMAPYETFIKLDAPMQVTGTFGPNGFEGRLAAGPFSRFEDAVVVRNVNQRMAARMAEDGSFTAGRDDVLAVGEYLRANVFGDEQRRRQGVYRALLGGGAAGRTSERARLLVWTDPLDLRFQFSEGSRRDAWALVSVPIDIERPPAGSRIVVPPPFLACRAVTNPYRKGDAVAMTAAFDYRTGQWTQSVSPTQVWLRFALPRALLPVALDRAALTMEIKAPNRRVTLLAASVAGPASLTELESPLGTIRFENDSEELLALDHSGGLLVGIDVGGAGEQPAQPTAVAQPGTPWKIEYVQLEVAGETLEPE